MDPRLAHPAAVRRRALPAAAIASLAAIAWWKLSAGRDASAGALLLRYVVLFAAFASLFTLTGYLALFRRWRRGR